MTGHTDHPSSTYFQEIPVAAIVLSTLLSKRFDTLTRARQFKKYASHALTGVLVTVSLVGLYQLATIFWPSGTTPSSAPNPASAVVATAPESQSPTPQQTQALPRSIPTRLEVPAIGISGSILGVGQNDDGSMEVPEADVVGWYAFSPTPGEIGPAILVGHVDSAISGPAIFYNLDKLQVGEEITVHREDGKPVTFVVEKSASYDQNNFPTDEVYGNLDYPGLRLITCDGDFNYLTRSYSHNLVVYARAKL